MRKKIIKKTNEKKTLEQEKKLSSKLAKFWSTELFNFKDGIFSPRVLNFVQKLRRARHT